MISPPGWSGVAFSERSDGDLRNDASARSAAAGRIGLDQDWAEVTQVHGDTVIEATEPGVGGEADALWTTQRGLPLAVFTADCFGVVLVADGAVGVAHAGWRGLVAGVVPKLRAAMDEAGNAPVRAAVGPGIGPCCFEVGSEVAELFTAEATTTWETDSVDLRAELSEQLAGLDVWTANACTFHDPGWFSHRFDGTTKRLATIGWVP
ncbi:MAG TPA: polyphenol oxidase family protein [Acidimicrobiia bacterium]